MKKQLFAILFALVAVSCTKEMIVEEEQKAAPAILFTATTGNEAVDSKSYIGAIQDGSSVLWWSKYDALGVYSYKAALGSGEAETPAAEKCALKDRTQAVAHFEGSSALMTSGTNYFYAYYPELGESVKSESNGVVTGFSVPSLQVEHFGKYHICSSKGYGKVVKDEAAETVNVGLAFAPRTALFTFKIYVNSDNTEVESVKLSRVKVTFDGSDSKGTPVNVTGNCSLNLADGSLTYIDGGSNSITVSMNGYYNAEVGTAIARKKADGVKAASFDLVLLPVENFSGKVKFDFLTSDSDINIPSVEQEVNGKSLAAGKHYSSSVIINPAKGTETANCYMIDANTTSSIDLPILQGARGWAAIDSYNRTTGSNSNTFEDWFWDSLDGEVTGEMLWSETEGMTAECVRDGNFLNVTFTGAKNGSNAVVALKDAKGAVLWSWHIWFTDYNPDTTPDPTTLKVTNGYVHKYQGTEWAAGGIYADKYIMDRNLGAKMTGFTAVALPSAAGDQTHSGLYYQYGRKDPFRPGKYTTAKGPVTMDNGALNPDVFYYRNDGIFDWAVNGNHTNTDPWAGWSAQVLPKSAFDPCPKGWRVPVAYMSEKRETVYTWSHFSTTNLFIGRDVGFYYRGTSTTYGSSYDCGNTAYPPCGRLSYKDGELASTETTCLWSSSPQPQFAAQTGVARYFISSAGYKEWDNVTGKIDAGSRAAGMPVRCVKE